jgi:GNAT superfamily N-acetyltransferase
MLDHEYVQSLESPLLISLAVKNEADISPPTESQFPRYDNFREVSALPGIYYVKMVRDFEDMAKIIAIRASACFSDPEHLYAKHFDGNDFSATHLIGHIGNEPVAAIRIRYFATFARIERLTVRPTHRKSRIAFKMVQAAFAFCRDKGYCRLSGVAREEMVPFWSLFGGQVSQAKDPIFIYGLPHFEMHIEFPESPTAITRDTDPLVLLRPEGRWREAGHHETIKVTRPADPDTAFSPAARALPKGRAAEPMRDSPVSRIAERMAMRRRRHTGQLPDRP